MLHDSTKKLRISDVADTEFGKDERFPIVRYEWRKGAPFPKEQVESTGRALVALEKKFGKIERQHVVDAARSKSSELHWAFTWDDKAAAEKQRLREAGEIIGALRIVVKQEDVEYTVPAMVSVRVQDPVELEPEESDEESGPSSRAYYGIRRVMDDESWRAALMDQAKRELIAWRRRYAVLSEFASFFEKIDAFAA